jgi:transcriptional regulator with XRE-family HTH domain
MTAPTAQGVVEHTAHPRPNRLESSAAEPVLGEILRRARTHCGFSLRQVEERSGIANAHLSQIERGSIKRPDIALLMELAELYHLDYRLVAEWGGYLDRAAARSTSREFAGLALRLFVSLDAAQQHEALHFLEALHSKGEPRS